MRLSTNFILKFPQTFNDLYIVEDRNSWNLCSGNCNKELDLILTTDFGLKQKLDLDGYNVEFMDHLASGLDLEEMNFKVHHFLDNWYKDEMGNPILVYKKYNLGDALLLNIISEVIYFTHYFFNLAALKNLKFKTIHTYVKDSYIIEILNKLGFNYNINKCNLNIEKKVYKFPIIDWVTSKTTETIMFKIKNIFANLLDYIFMFLIRYGTKSKIHIYIQKYFPTDPIIPILNSDKRYQIILQNYLGLSSVFKYRRIHLNNNLVSPSQSQILLLKYKNSITYRWSYQGCNIDEMLKQLIIPILEKHLHQSLNIAHSIDRWMKYFNLKLMVSVTNFWVNNRLLMQYCFNNNIPVLTIINGQLNTSFTYDAKDSNFVNCYSDSMKKNYFQNKETVFPLGDPRMDQYANIGLKNINRNNPIIIIGAGGYDSTDLNSYIAFEFDFMYDILVSLSQLIEEGYCATIIIKVRANGYIEMYKSFINEYFPNLKISLVQNVSFIEVIKSADLYISFFSQTIFEAACFGIPTIYYKKDTQFIHTPFDAQGELVTVNTQEGLVQKIKLFYSGDKIFDLFLDKKILEKYIGPLDGLNTKRNINFINKLIEKNRNPI